MKIQIEDFFHRSCKYPKITSENITTPTDGIIVYVLPPLEAGILAKPDTICLDEDILLEFEIGDNGKKYIGNPGDVIFCNKGITHKISVISDEPCIRLSIAVDNQETINV